MLDKFEAFQMAKKYYWLCKEAKLPRYLQDQLFRASSSIALNLAEGSGKRTVADQKRFYSISLGSLRECSAILELEKINDPILQELQNRLGAILYVLSKRPVISQPNTVRKTLTETETVTDMPFEY